MTSHTASRRRRVLHEEVRQAALQATIPMSTIDGAPTPRYGEQAGVEHHPQITDYIPRRNTTILAVVAGGAAVAGGAEALAHSAGTIAGIAAGVTAEQIASVAAGATAWTAAILGITTALTARLIFSLRRHRIDDVRGRYRVWRWVARGATLLSINAIVGLHTLVASVATAATGWSLTAGGAEWWLAPTVIVAGWLGVRLLQEIAESRGTVALLATATTCYGVAAAGALGWSPAALGAWSDVLTTALPLVGHAFALAAGLTFARYVVLDVQELIEHKPRKTAKPSTAPREPAAAVAQASTAPAAPGHESAPAARGLARPTDIDAAADDDDESQDGQYLSKAERKRLRKQQRRAA
jgi:hypothetical protein